MAVPVLLQVLDRAGVTTGWVVQLSFLKGAAWLTPRYEETWNYKQLSDNSQSEGGISLVELFETRVILKLSFTVLWGL